MADGPGAGGVRWGECDVEGREGGGGGELLQCGEPDPSPPPMCYRKTLLAVPLPLAPALLRKWEAAAAAAAADAAAAREAEGGGGGEAAPLVDTPLALPAELGPPLFHAL